MAGGGGILFNPDGVQEWVYSWGLKEDSNNVVEGLALWQGLCQARAHGISEIVVVEESRLIIQALMTNSLPTQLKLHQLIKKFQILSKSFNKIDYFHVLRSLN